MVFDEAELREVKALAVQQGMTVSEWVRQAVRKERRAHAEGDRTAKLEAARTAARHSFPTGDIDQMVAEIERGDTDQ